MEFANGVELWQIAVGLSLSLVGLIAGLWLGRGDRQSRARAESLETELRAARSEHDAYRARVEKHFEKTSEHFRELTEQYTAVYAHLAEGARSLCPEGSQALGRGLSDPLLERGLLGAGAEESALAPESRRSAAEELEPISEVSPLLGAIDPAPEDGGAGAADRTADSKA